MSTFQQTPVTVLGEVWRRRQRITPSLVAVVVLSGLIMLPLETLRKRIEPVVLCAQIASAFFDTGLQMVVKEQCATATDALNPTPNEDSRQKAMSNFYMIYNMLSKFVPILPAIILARVSQCTAIFFDWNFNTHTMLNVEMKCESKLC